MRNTLLIAIIVLFAGSGVFLVTAIAKKISIIKQVSEKIKTLPQFSFVTLDNEIFSSTDIKSGPLLIVRFHPECEHCHYEISEIIKNITDLPDGLILLISDAPSDSIRKFMEHFSESRLTGIVSLADPSSEFGTIFGSDIVPSNYIYDRDLKLVKIFYGEVKPDVLINLMRDGA